MLTFLKNQDNYTDDERERCLILLNYLEIEEIIPDVITYVSGGGNNQTKEYALQIISHFNEDVLLEYNVKDQLYEFLVKTISRGELIGYEPLFNMLYNHNVSEKDERKFGECTTITIICSYDSESLYDGYDNFYQNFDNVKELTLEGIINDSEIIKYFVGLDRLVLNGHGDISSLIEELCNQHTLKDLTSIDITADQINYICESDFAGMPNLEKIKIQCMYEKMDFSFDGFIGFKRLKEVTFVVCDEISYELADMVDNWHSYNDQVDYIITSDINLTNLG